MALRHDGKESWLVSSDERTDLKTFAEYGRRFDIEENFLDDKSNERTRNEFRVNVARDKNFWVQGTLRPW
jgi:hypothetical protein